MRITDQVSIDETELSEQFVRAGGPGGQNVNKVSTAVELRFDAAASPNLPDDVKQRLQQLAGKRWTKDGAIVIRVEDERSQARNREIARARLAELVRAACTKPKPRKATRPPAAAKRRRLEDKQQRARTKSLRKVDPDG
jgi:ribosome-associated protein